VGKVICVFGQKGGAGKTTTVVNLAAVLALSCKRTLLIDMDIQGSATAMVSVQPRRYHFSIQDVILQGVPIEKSIVRSCLSHLSVLPAPRKVSLNDHIRASQSTADFLKKALAPIKDRFDYILMDAPTSDWSYISHAAAASDYLLFILRADYQTFHFLGNSLELIKSLKAQLNPKLKLAGIILTLYDPRDASCLWILRKALFHLPKWLFRTLIPKNPFIASSAFKEKPIVVCDYDGKISRSFRFLAKEFIERIG
jgi:chromosome partitioning protein